LYGINSVSSLLLSRHRYAIFSFYWPTGALGHGMGHIGVSCDGIPSSIVFVVDAISRKFKSAKIKYGFAAYTII
jgi:hypothetical protein